MPAGYDLSTLEIFRNGVLVPDCAAPGSGQANPTPCIDARAVLPDGDYSITAVTVQASLWAVGVANHYTFGGFIWPVNNAPVFNRIGAGLTVPIIFKLGGDKGMNVLANGFPTSSVETCGSKPKYDDVEIPLVTPGSGLFYEKLTKTYIYFWKTDTSWAGTCRVFTLKLADGTIHVAHFRLEKLKR